MRAAATIVALVVALAAPALAAPPQVALVRGNVVYVDADGTSRQLTREGVDQDPVLSPDGRTVAFVRVEARATPSAAPNFSALWVADGKTGDTKRLIGAKPADDPKADLTEVTEPAFSLNGGFVYVLARAWATSAAVHQVDLKTGQERFVLDANSLAVIRNGRYAGYLFVSRHGYRAASEGGAFDAHWVVRPDAKEMFMVPGSDGADGDARAKAWLAQNRYEAW